MVEGTERVCIVGLGLVGTGWSEDMSISGEGRRTGVGWRICALCIYRVGNLGIFGMFWRVERGARLFYRNFICFCFFLKKKTKYTCARGSFPPERKDKNVGNRVVCLCCVILGSLIHPFLLWHFAQIPSNVSNPPKHSVNHLCACSFSTSYIKSKYTLSK